MIYTNRHQLPTPLFLALKGKDHKRKSDISVTELGLAPRQLALRRRHDTEICVDVSDRIWALTGTAMHEVIEKFAKYDKQGISEQYLMFEMAGPKCVWKIGGMMDYLSEDSLGRLTITDWKFVSVYSYIFERENGGVKPEYEAQLNIYDYALHKNGMDIHDLQIVFIFRDWKKSDLAKSIANGKTDYPDCQIVVAPVRRWDRQQQEAHVLERVRVHQLAIDQADDDLPICTPEERWERGECWAVMRHRRSTAARIFPSAAEAKAFVGADTAMTIIHRPGKPTKCLEYCDVGDFCSFRKSLLGQETMNV